MLGSESIREMFAVVVERDVLATIELQGRVAELDDRKQIMATMFAVGFIAEVTELS